MKVLAAISKEGNLQQLGNGSHIGDTPNHNSELVVLEHCEDCDPQNTHFRGVESNRHIRTAIVTERSDLDDQLLLNIFIDGFERNMHLSNLSRDIIVQGLRQEIAMTNQAIFDLELGTIVRREQLSFHQRPGRRRRRAS